MRYLLLVAHGEFAPGLHSALNMLEGERDDVLDVPFHDGMTQDAFKAQIREVIAPITTSDRVIVLGDLIGGSPLTNALNTLAAHGLLAQTRAFGGVNLPMVLTAAFDLQTDDEDALCASMVSEGQAALSEMALDLGGEDESEDEDL